MSDGGLGDPLLPAARPRMTTESPDDPPSRAPRQGAPRGS